MADQSKNMPSKPSSAPIDQVLFTNSLGPELAGFDAAVINLYCALENALNRKAALILTLTQKNRHGILQSGDLHPRCAHIERKRLSPAHKCDMP